MACIIINTCYDHFYNNIESVFPICDKILKQIQSFGSKTLPSGLVFLSKWKIQFAMMIIMYAT